MKKRPATNGASRVCKKPATAQSAPNTRAPSRHVTCADVRSGAVPHYYDVALHDMDVSDIRIAIPSYDRPETLCEATLSLLKRHGFPLNQVHVFVSPIQVWNSHNPEWKRYLNAMRREGFHEVNLEVGCHGLEHQMHAIFTWAHHGDLIVMTDDVQDILERRTPHGCTKAELTPLPLGMLSALFLHGRDMLKSSACFAWSLNCSHNVRSLDETSISRRFGLLEGNVTGFRLEGNPEDWRVPDGFGVVYDVALSCNLWSTGRMFLRYRGLCLAHRYRAAGGCQATMRLEERRRLEDRAIQALARNHANLIRFKPKPDASLCTMQFEMLQHGSRPLKLKPATPVTGGRRFEAFADRAMTPAERQRRCRRGRRSLSAS